MTGARAAAAGVGLGLAALGALLASGDGGTVVVGGEAIRTGPVPAWLVRALYSPPPWAGPVLAVSAAAVVSLACAGYMRSGLTPDVRREVLSNLVVVTLMGAAAVLAVRAPLVPYWAAVPAGAGAGFALSVPARRWLGVADRP